jgi:hypothetical protein
MRRTMTTNSISRSGFFNTRVLVDFALCSIGILLALAGLSESVTGAASLSSVGSEADDGRPGHAGVGDGDARRARSKRRSQRDPGQP